jgi:uncharacterized protein YegP (UPF0339 family)
MTNPIKLVVYKYKGEWRWKIINQSGQNVATGSRGYTRKSDCKRGVLRLIMDVTLSKFDVSDGWDARER